MDLKEQQPRNNEMSASDGIRNDGKIIIYDVDRHTYDVHNPVKKNSTECKFAL